MQLVFIHGWGFDPQFWDRLLPLLPNVGKRKINLGFLGDHDDTITDAENTILVGHSLGLAYGIKARSNWAGWIAINGFSRFVASDTQKGCVPLAALVAMTRQIKKDPQRTLDHFYKSIDAIRPAAVTPNVARLCEGLKELRECDISRSATIHAKPGLVLAAQNDPLVPFETSKTMNYPHAVIKIHPSGGHILPQNQPDWCAAMIHDFLQTNFALKI